MPIDNIEQYLLLPLERQQDKQQQGPSQLQVQPPTAMILFKPRTIQDKNTTQLKTEELDSNPNLKGHPKYDMSLDYKLQNLANIYKLVSYNRKTNTYRAKKYGG